LVREFRPDLIILQHGVDAHTGDRLAALQYTRASYSFAVRTLVRLATEVCGGRIVVTGGGGYSPEHVALRLAEAALVLSDPEQTDESDRDLPDSWRNEFRVAFRTEAPMSLREPSRRAPSPWRAAHHQELIAQLSRNLGVRFPRLEQT
jgi:acetoin utilization protein AcuC